MTKDNIKIKFKKIGAAAAAANLFSEFSIPAKKEAKLAAIQTQPKLKQN